MIKYIVIIIIIFDYPMLGKACCKETPLVVEGGVCMWAYRCAHPIMHVWKPEENCGC